MLKAARYDAEGGIRICGECHRTPDRTNVLAAPELEDPLSVRFQPVGLLASRGFTTGRKIQCVTCHDPHVPTVRGDAGYYTAKCRSCHAAAPGAKSQCERRNAAADCVGCHMKRVSPAPPLEFTDHRIRID
jgi:predicted CXXCH cytochrome family protein